MEERIGFGVVCVVRNSGGLNPYCSGRKNPISYHCGARLSCQLGLNPYCSGRKNRMQSGKCLKIKYLSLNPYCSGRKNRILSIMIL